MEENKIKRLESLAISPEVAIFDMLDEINSKIDVISKSLEGMDLSQVDTIKGDKPEKGIDYLTDDEMEALIEVIKEEVTPVKDVDYFDGEKPDIEEIIKEVIKRIK